MANGFNMMTGYFSVLCVSKRRQVKPKKQKMASREDEKQNCQKSKETVAKEQSSLN